MTYQRILDEADHILEQCARAVDQNGTNDFLDGKMQTAETFRKMALEGINQKQ